VASENLIHQYGEKDNKLWKRIAVHYLEYIFTMVTDIKVNSIQDICRKILCNLKKREDSSAI